MASRPMVEGWWPIRFPHVLRDANEKLGQSPSDEDSPVGLFYCECCDPSCTAQIELTLDEYEQLREGPGRFVVAPGHEHPPLAWVVEEGERFSVVEADGGAFWRPWLDARQ